MGDHIIIANGALLGGHVTVQDRAFISGNCLVHQFMRVGTLAIMQGGSAISKDLPPFTIARGDNGICGLNVVGLRRAGFTAEQRLELQKLYHALVPQREKFAGGPGRGAEKFQQPGGKSFARISWREQSAALCSDTGRANQ